MKLFSLALAAAVLATLAAPTLAQGLPDLGGRTIEAVTSQDYPPLTMIDEKTGEGVGWEYDAFNEIAKRLNAKVHWNVGAWETMLAALHDKQYDVGMVGISILDERKSQVDFSDPYMNNQVFMLVRADESRITDPGSFAANTDLFIGA